MHRVTDQRPLAGAGNASCHPQGGRGALSLKGQDMAGMCETCARKKKCGAKCDGYVPKGPQHVGGRNVKAALEFHGDMATLEDMEAGRGRRVRRPVDYAE